MRWLDIETNKKQKQTNITTSYLVDQQDLGMTHPGCVSIPYYENCLVISHNVMFDSNVQLYIHLKAKKSIHNKCDYFGNSEST